MKKHKFLKSTLCLFMAMVCNVAWAQEAQTFTHERQTAAPVDGYYLMYSESSSGNGWIHYDATQGKKYRVATDVDLSSGVKADQAKFIWKLVNNGETFTLLNLSGKVYMPADAARNQNMSATTTANLAIEAIGGDGNDGKWFVSQTNYKNGANILYIHTNAPGGYPNLSYWDSKSVGGTSICAQFYKVDMPETTYTVNYLSEEYLIATTTFTYPTGFEVPEFLVSDATPDGYYIQNSTLEGTTCTVNVSALPAISDAPADGQWAQNTTWFRMETGDDYSYRADVLTADGYLALTNKVDAVGDVALWCIVGDEEKGYHFYNRAKGAAVVLGMKNGYAEFVAAGTSGYITAFDIVRSQKTGNTYWCAKEHGSANNFLNRKNNGDYHLQFWNSASASGTDNGSAMLFTEVDLSTLTELYAPEEDITAAQALIKVAPGYPKKTSAQYHMLNVMVNSVGKGIVASELTTAVNNYKTCSDIILPEDGKAYTFTSVMGSAADATRYYMKYENGKKVSVSKTAGDASIFVCKELSTTNANEKKYAFVTADGSILTWVGNNENGAYKENNNIYGYSSHYAAEYNNLADWNEITIKKNGTNANDLGYLRLVARRNSSGTSSIIANADNRFDQASDGYWFNGTNSSAWILTEVEHTDTEKQTVALAEIDATIDAIAHVDANAGVLGEGVGYKSYMVNEQKVSTLSTVKTAINNATTAEDVNTIKNSLTANLPEAGKAYKMAFKTKAGALHHIVANEKTLSSDTDENNASVFYCTQDTSKNGYPYVFISAEGKILTFKALTDTYTKDVNDIKVGAMVDVSSGNINSDIAVRLGTVYIATNKRPGGSNNDDGCFVFKNQGGANTYDGATAPFHNDNFTSAIVMTEVEGYDINADGNAAVKAALLNIAKAEAKAHVEENKNQLGNGVELGYYVLNGVKSYDAEEVNAAIDAATTVESVMAIKESFAIYKGVKIANKDEFANNGVYSFKTSKGWLGATESCANVISTAKTSHNVTGDHNDPMFQWAVYQSANGNYYLYNLGKQMFMGVQNNNEQSIPFVEYPAGKKLTFKQSNSVDYPIMFSTDNAGVVNHNGDISSADGVFTWTGGWNNLNDAGSNHQVTLVSQLPETTLQEIADKVEFYLNNVTALDQLSNTATYKVYGERGFIYATEGGDLKGTNQHSVAYDETNPYHHFAILKVDENYYLYNVGAKKFVIKNGNTASLSDTPARQTFAMGAASNLNTAYDWVLRLDGTLTHLSNAVGSGVYVNNGAEDGGTRWAIFKTGSFTPDDALYVINNYNRQLYVKAEVEGSWENNPNTHFGSVTATTSAGTTLKTTLKTNPSVVMLDYNGLEETTISFTRDYRGFEFQGYSFGGVDLGKSFTLTEEQKASITEQNPLVAKFTTTDDVTLFYDDDPFSYRIPAIGKTSTGRLIAVSDYRYSLDDIGRYNFGTANPGIDLVMRYSDDNGKTWSETKTIAKGSCVRGTDDCAYGDAAIAVVGQKVLVMGAAGDVMFGNGSATAHNRAVRIFSEDNGETWTKQDISETLFLGDDATIKNGYSSFFGSGRLAVDDNYNGTGKARIYGALLLKKASGTGNYVIYTDDLGLTWHILGGSQDPIANQDEPKVEILPSGQILLSVRRGGGRQFNVFTYTDKATNAGTWDSNVNGCSNGGSNTCNGEPFLVDAVNAQGEAVKLLLQSQPKGGSDLYDRRDVTIWYKEVTDATYTSAQIAADWTQGLQVSTQQSAYSAMALQDDGKIAFFFEEAPCYGDDQAKGYCMVYVPLTIDQITKGHYFAPDADLTTERTISVVLTDAQGNEYRDQVQSGLTCVADTLTTKYPFITIGDNANLETDGETFTYTNTVTLPFKVSNEETTVWHNIYFPANGRTECYPVYLMDDGADDVKTSIKETGNHGAQSMNTYSNADKISWAIYQAGDGFNFIFKNKLNGRYIKVNGNPVSGRGNNTQYTTDLNEAVAFGIVDGRNNSYVGEYGISFNGGQLTVYSVDDKYVSYSTGTAHQGGWVKIVEAPDFEALIAEVNATLGMIGDKLGQYTATEANVAVAAEAKVAMENSATVKLNDLNSYKDLLNGAALNMPVADQFFRVAYDYGNAGKLYMQSTASSVKGLEFTAATDAASIWVYYDGALYSYTAGQCLREHGDDRGLQAVGGKTTATFSASGRAKGKYTLQCGSYVHANTSNGKYYTDHCSGNNCAQHDLILEEVTALPVNVNANLGFASFYTPVALTIPEGMTAYVVTSVNTTSAVISVLAEVGAVIPANTGVLLRANGGGDFTLAVADAADAVTLESENLLNGTIADQYVEYGENIHYMLGAYKGGNGSGTDAGFFEVAKNLNSAGGKDEENGTHFKNNGFKSYLTVPGTGAQGAPSLAIRFEGTTQIENSEIRIQNSELIFDLQGRRVEHPGKGLYIVNGKKVIF